MSRNFILLMVVVLVTVPIVFAQNSKPATEPPKNLDGKGFFVLPQEMVKQLKIKSVTTTDWLFKDDGTTSDRERGSYAEYDTSGKLIRFSGHVDQGGYKDLEYLYDNKGNVIEEQVFFKVDGTRELIVKGVFSYPEPNIKEQSIYGADGSLMKKTRYLLDDAGRILERQILDMANGSVLRTVKRKYDKRGNFVEEYGEGRTVYKLEKRVLKVSQFTGPKIVFNKGRLNSTMEYSFDDDNNLQSYYRESGSGSFWDRFTYTLSEKGLPIEKIWSRREYVLQDPYELTKYSYEYF